MSGDLMATKLFLWFENRRLARLIARPVDLTVFQIE